MAISKELKKAIDKGELVITAKNKAMSGEGLSAVCIIPDAIKTSPFADAIIGKYRIEIQSKMRSFITAGDSSHDDDQQALDAAILDYHGHPESILNDFLPSKESGPMTPEQKKEMAEKKAKTAAANRQAFIAGLTGMGYPEDKIKSIMGLLVDCKGKF